MRPCRRKVIRTMSTSLTQQSLGYAVQSVAGQVRGHNEDAVLCLPRLRLWAVADGMGGHQCGEVASALALEALQREIAHGMALDQAILSAHRSILEASAQVPGRTMGSTVVAVHFQEDEFEVAWVGDSRAYRISLEGIVRLTHDHSWVQAMIDAGELTQEQARKHPRRNIVTQCLGLGEQELDVGRVRGRMQTGELLLLCSDGLTGELDDSLIQQACASAVTLDELVEQLVGLANQMGGRDNISCIVLAHNVTDSAQVFAKSSNFLSRWLTSLKP